MSSDSEVDPYPTANRAAGGGASEEGAARPGKKWIMYVALAVPAVILLVIAVATRGDDDKDTSRAAGGTSTTQPGGDNGGSGEGAKVPVPPEAWEPDLVGRPASLGEFGLPAAEVKPGARPGLYLWSDFKGWHLWVVAGEGVPNEVSGLITSDGDLQPGQLALDGSGTVNTDGKAITFTLATDQPVVGIDFNLYFYAKVVTVAVLDAEGKPVDLPVRLGTPGTEKPLPLEIRKG